MSSTGDGGIAHLGWSDAELRSAYSRLSTIEEATVSDLLDEDQWVRSNQLLDEGVLQDEIASRIGVSEFAILQVNSPRRCLALHNGDTEALRKCLRGEATTGGSASVDA